MSWEQPRINYLAGYVKYMGTIQNVTPKRHSPVNGHFYAVDVETANFYRSSICQIGLVEVKDGEFVSEWKTYINPQMFFDPWNTRLHGIDAKTVADAPTFEQAAERFGELVDGMYLISHSAFDRGAIREAYEANMLAPCEPIWLDSARMSRRAWHGSDLISDGVSLSVLAEKLDISFAHHDALEDAKTCAKIALKIFEDSGMEVEGWVKRQEQPINPSAADHRREGSSTGPLAGEVVVFTGQLSKPRREMADMVAGFGAAVENSVTKRTTILVVGDQDQAKLAGYTKSSKHRKVEQLIKDKNQQTQIISEQDLLVLSMGVPV